MIEPLPGRPIRSSVPHRLEKFHVYLFLVLGIALVGAGLTAMGIATISPAVVGIGAGTLVAAGLIAFYFALAGSRLTVEEKSIQTDQAQACSLIRAWGSIETSQKSCSRLTSQSCRYCYRQKAI